MDSDDDYQSFFPLEESPSEPQSNFKRLKKLKVTEVRSNSSPPPASIDLVVGHSGVDLALLEAPEDSAPKTLKSVFDDDSNESLPSQIESLMETENNDSPHDMGFDDEVPFEDNRKETKRVLEFGDRADDETDGNLGRLEKKRTSEGGLSDTKDEERDQDFDDKKKRNKRIKRDRRSDEMKSKSSASDKRSQEKERKAYLKQLHAESQRLLRETREVAFKPLPVVSKPISSVLEKIRQRKLELSKRNAQPNGNVLVTDHMMSIESNSNSFEQRKGGLTKPVEEDTHVHPENFGGKSATEKDNFTKSAVQSINAKVHADKPSPSEASPPIFRPPINDTEDLFLNSETQDDLDELPDDIQESPSDEVAEPSLLSMNLKLDSDLYEDSSSEEEEEEEDDKENIDPLLHRGENNSASPRGAPAEAFLDDEAEEEDNRDNDLMRFKENEEDEDMEDSEEFNDIIATNYTENLVDHDRRNELHQKWLAQQDAAGTDNLLQKLKIGSKPNDDIFLGEEQEIGEEEDYNFEDVALKNSARMNSKKAKEMITQMFEDKDEAFLSDEDEEIERLRVKHHLLIKAEEQATLLSPMEDESSREVFGLIKKLNIVPENRRKAKAASYFDSVSKGGNSNSFSKQSFLRRLPNHLPSFHKQGSGTARSFIFGRDDSNSSRSSITTDDSSDTVPKENKNMKTSGAAFTSSQAKFNSQYKNTPAVTASGASLFEILKRASIQSSSCDNGDRVDLTPVLSTFKVPRRQIKVDGRT